MPTNKFKLHGDNSDKHNLHKVSKHELCLEIQNDRINAP